MVKHQLVNEVSLISFIYGIYSILCHVTMVATIMLLSRARLLLQMAFLDPVKPPSFTTVPVATEVH